MEIYKFKHECEDCDFTWFSDFKEQDCPDCGSSNCYHFNQEDK